MARPAPFLAASLVAAGIVLASLAATGTVTAKHGGDDPSPTGSPSATAKPSATASPAAAATPSPSASPDDKGRRSRDATVVARVSSAQQGGSIKVRVRVAHPAKGAVFAARATANFATGPVTIDLRRSGEAFVAVGRIPVTATQPMGPVSVTILVRYADSTSTIARTVLVRPAGDDDASPSPTASPTASSRATP